MPVCLVGAVDNPRTVADLVSAALHEIDCFESNEDGHLNGREIRQVKTFLSKMEAA